MRIKVLALFLITIGLYSCNSTSNNLDSLKFECGYISSQITDDLKVLKLVGPSDQDFDNKSMSALAVLDTGQSKEVTISSKGCVSYETSFESLRIRTTFEGKILSAVANKSEVTKPFSHLKLSPSSDYKLDFICPTDGIYGKNDVDIAIKFDSASKPTEAGFKILARSLRDKSLTQIVEKKIGREMESFGIGVDLSLLPVGDYQLEIATTSLSLGLSENYALASTDTTCLLHRIDATPVLGGNLEKKLISVGDRVVTPFADAKFSYCKVPLREIIDPSLCELQNSCVNTGEFSTSSEMVGQGAGTFRYFYFITDKAGDRSNLACQDVSVSDRAPAVNIQWTNPVYSRPGGSIDKPYVRLSMKIDVSHPVRDRDELESKMMCSGKFVIKNGLEIPAKVVICESDECKGRDLSRPVPCGTDLKINMKKVYDSKELWDSVFKVSVVSDDGSGNKSSDEAGVWLNSSRWDIEEIGEGMSVSIKEEARFRGNTFYKSGTDVIFGSSLSTDRTKKEGLVIQFHGNEKYLYTSPTDEFTSPFISPPEGTVPLIVLWRGNTADKCRLIKYSKESVEGEELVVPENCEQFQVMNNEFGYLWGFKGKSGEDGIIIPFRFDGKKWDYLEPVTEQVAYCSSKLKLKIISETDFDVVCDALNLKIEYRKLLRLKAEKDFPEVPLVAVPDENAYVNGVRCDEDGMFLQGDELYYPMRELVNKIDHSAGDIQWEKRYCNFYAATGHSIYLNEPDSLYKITISEHSKPTSVHFPEDWIGFSMEPLVDTAGAHPIFVTRDYKVKILDSFFYTDVSIPQDLLQNIRDDSFRIRTWDGNSLLILRDDDYWVSNSKSEWVLVRSGEVLSYEPIWSKMVKHECMADLPEEPMLGENSMRRWSKLDRVDYPCSLVEREFAADGKSNFKISVAKGAIWEKKVEFSTECTDWSSEQFEYSQIIKIRCSTKRGGDIPLFIDTEKMEFSEIAPPGRIDVHIGREGYMGGDGLWNKVDFDF